MSHKQRTVLESVFHEPIKNNIQWRDVESLLHHLGATVEAAHGARFRVLLNGRELMLHHPHHSNEFTRPAVEQLREFLAGAGVTPSLYDARQQQ